VTADDAAAAALEHLRAMQPQGWDPVIVRVEDVGGEWRVFYNSRAYVETSEPRSALAGNWPLLVPKNGGAIRQDEAYRRDSLGLSN
jgi:Immunity protein 35